MEIGTILLAGAGALGILAGATFLLPGQVQVERRAVIDAAPAEVIALAASSAGYQRFNPYLTADPALKIVPFGPESGVGAGFRFEGKDGTGTQTVAEVGPDRVVYAIDLGSMGQPRQSLTARPVAGGTEVVWRMEAEMGANPVFRVFGLFMDRMMGKTFEQGLRNLADATA